MRRVIALPLALVAGLLDRKTTLAARDACFNVASSLSPVLALNVFDAVSDWNLHMRRFLTSAAFALFFATTTLAAPVVALEIAPGVTANPDWSAGYERAYLDLCDVTPAERAAWASPVPAKGPRLDPAAYADGFMTAVEDAAYYDDEGFDRVEFCGDYHP